MSRRVATPLFVGAALLFKGAGFVLEQLFAPDDSAAAFAFRSAGVPPACFAFTVAFRCHPEPRATPARV
jgi:hypothetical protein